jgi:hypothetical protein
MPDLTPDVERELAALDDALAGRRVASDLTELGELALALREERPRPTDGFGRSLDTRVERGFPGRDPRVRVSGRRWWSALLSMPALGTATAVLIVVAIVVADPAGHSEGGGAGSAGGGAETSLADGGDAAAPESAGTAAESSGGREAAVAQDESAPDATTGFSEPLPSVAPAPGDGSPGSDGRVRRAVERSASLTLAARPRDIDDVSRRIQAVTSQQGGFVVSSTVSSSAGGGGGTFELRIPTSNLDEAIDALSRLGRVRERAQRSQDITAETVSARSRLKDARTERKSLLRQLAAAVTVNETAAIRTRLDLVSREIEQARAAVRRVRNRAAFSTVSVTLVGDSNAVVPADDDDQWTPGDAAKDALRVLEVAAGVALIVLAVVVPLALLAALGGLAARWSRRRRREHALDAV